MNRKAVHIVVIALALAGIGTLASTAEGVDRAPQDCMYNDDCTSPLVCAAGRCRIQCRSDRDCSVGSRCALNASAPARSMCIPQALPSTNGFIVGRVDASPGVPLARCTVDLGSDSPSASCDSRGEFILSNVPPGRYDVRIRPGTSDVLPRTIVAYVDSGMHSSVGTITLSSQRFANVPQGYENGNNLGFTPVVVLPVPKGGSAPAPSPKK